MPQNKTKVISVVGPTASGKTALAVSVAKDFHGEIISADSMQIYKGMDIATAKPTAMEMCGIMHHLVDYVEPSESYSVARFVEDAKAAIEQIVSHNKLPIIAGGTGLYTDSFLDGISFAKADTDLELRKNLVDKCENEGLDSLLQELEKIDPDSYKRLSVEKNPKRIIRALEIYYTTGITQTEQNEISKGSPSEFLTTYIGLKFRDRQKLYDRINMRVDRMIEAGLLSEAENFFASPLGNTSIQAIGYKELKPYILGNVPLDECVETLKRSTRRYAKRQLTWFNRNERVNWFFVDDFESSQELYLSVQKFLINEGFEIT
ncbi:MAG: tRNA (adenosine(37)-N6)-dimethylallyltransferase MiaA [Eubacteriales bacterium]|nr:tRNA (adenosine(37)-N6)-dimethylallyltransferase MiaA [Eubacteriales bacterium]